MAGFLRFWHRKVPLLLERTTETIAGVPQTVFSLPFDETVSPVLAELDMSRILERVIVGPTQFGWVVYETCLTPTRAGVPNAGDKVWVSNIPIRD